LTQTPYPYDDWLDQRAQPVRRKPRRDIASEYGPFLFGGVMLIAAFAFAGHYMGQNAIAHNAAPDESLALVAPTSMILTKGSLLSEGETMDIVNLRVLESQQVVAAGKANLDIPEPPVAPVAVVRPKPAKLKVVSIEPAAVNLKGENAPAKRLVAVPAPKAVEQPVKLTSLSAADKQKVVARRRIQLAEENCLARAIYFEARSESELGQLAVARVILNRTKSPDYPKSICGVVYQGTNRRNSCQFSFACDGLPDDVRQPGAWANAKRVAQKAMAGQGNSGALARATNYHADYVKPRWARSLRKLVKIGTHIFYSDS
jgi:spore germination cell wall hydrolase CwlJ-like protein